MARRRRPNAAVRRTLIRRRILAVVASLAVLAVVPWLVLTVADVVLTSRAFIVQRVIIEGNTQMTEDAIRAAAGLDRPRNRLTLDEVSMEAAIMRLPWVSAVDVMVGSNGEVHILVEESRLFAVATLGAPVLIDIDGRVIRELLPTDSMDAPYLVGFERTLPDGTLDLDLASFREAKQVVALATPLADELGRVTEVHFSPSVGYRMVFSEGVDIMIGADAFDERFERIQQTLDALRERGHRPASLTLGGLDLNRVAVRLQNEVMQ